MNRSALGGVALLLVVATATSCSDEPDAAPDPDPTPTSTRSTPTSTPTPKTDEEKAAAQLTTYLDVRDDFYRQATIDFKRLNPVATGREFLNVQQHVSAIERSGGKVTGEYVHTLGEPRDRGAYILIIDCEDRSGVVNTNKEGKPVPEPKDPEGNPLRNPIPIEYKLVKEKGRWLVSEANWLWDEPC